MVQQSFSKEKSEHPPRLQNKQDKYILYINNVGRFNFEVYNKIEQNRTDKRFTS